MTVAREMPPPERRRLKLEGEWVLLVTLAAVFVGMSMVSPYFLEPSNLLEATRFMAEIGLVAMGMTFVMRCGGIDLSVGSNIALTGVVIGMLCDAGVNVWLAVSWGLVQATLCGVFNGIVVTRLQIPAIIVTIGTLAVFHGVALGISGAKAFPLPEPLYPLGQGYIGPVPAQLIIFLAITAVLAFVLGRTRFGRVISAIGYNETAARFAGLRTDRTKLLVYALSGLLSGLAAVIFIARVSSARENAGQGLELDAVTIAVLGGASIYGGKGTILGTLLGVLIVGFLRNGMTLGYVAFEVQNIFVGVILIVAVTINELLRRYQQRHFGRKVGS